MYKPGNLEMCVLPNHARGGVQIPIQEFEQGGLAGPIGSHEGQTGVQIYPKLQVLVYPGRVLRVTETHVLDHDDLHNIAYLLCLFRTPGCGISGIEKSVWRKRNTHSECILGQFQSRKNQYKFKFRHAVYNILFSS